MLTTLNALSVGPILLEWDVQAFPLCIAEKGNIISLSEPVDPVQPVF